MPITAFFVDALGSALQLGIATPDDVIRHVTPDVLAAHLPRPLWAKLLAACLATPRTDAKLVVDTIGVPALCEHVPGTLVWACLAEVGQRALGRSIVAPPPSLQAAAPAPERRGTLTPPPAARPVEPISDIATGPVVTRSPTLVTAGVPAPTRSHEEAVPVASTRAPTGPVIPPVAPPARLAEDPAPLAPPPGASRAPAARPPSTEVGRPPAGPGNGVRVTGAGASTRRPQAQAAPLPGTRPAAPGLPPRPTSPTPARTVPNADFDVETDVGADWRKRAPSPLVDDEQLVDWAQSDETVTGGVGDRKR